MKVGIVEYGGELSKLIEEELSKKIETVEFEKKKALDLFDVLAYARKMISLDQVIIIVRLDPEQQDMNRVFLAGLATLEGETGKNIFKCFYEEEEGEEKARQLADTFFNYLFHPERLVKKKEEPEDFLAL